jgi:hypothetical protein
LHRIAKELFEPIRGIVGGDVQQFDPLGLEPDLGEQALHRANANLGPVVALGQMALPLGTCDHAQASPASLESVKKVLCVHLAAARHLAHEYACAVLLPLPRQTGTAWDAVAADIHDDVRALGLRHPTFLTPTKGTASPRDTDRPSASRKRACCL